jgi:CBS domain-containing protein
MDMRKVAQILLRKGRTIESVQPGITVFDALQLMAEKNIGSVVVMNGDQFAGIVTERDYSRKVVLKHRSSTETKVEEIMSDNLPSVSPNDTIDTCMHLISEHNIRYLPVMEDGKLIGVVSISDVINETILVHQETISALKSYIQS